MKIKSAAGIFILFFIIAQYFLLLQPTMAQYQIAKKNKMAQFTLLTQKKSLVKTNKQTEKTLAIWAQKHPNFYSAMRLNQSSDDLLQLLTYTAQQAGFSIVQIAPVISKKKTAHFVSLKLLGNYVDLFYFIEKINQSAWPISLVALTIPKVGENQITIETSIYHISRGVGV